MARKRSRLGSTEREILQELSGGDLLIGFLCSARSSKRMYRIAHERALQRYRTKKVIDRLVMQGWAERNGDSLSITSTGKCMLDTTIERVRTSLLATTWDGKWRVVAFDIPENIQSLRYHIRAILKRAGFIKLQHSVWIFPHECREISELIKSDERVKKYVLYGVLEQIDDSERLEQLFFSGKRTR